MPLPFKSLNLALMRIPPTDVLGCGSISLVLPAYIVAAFLVVFLGAEPIAAWLDICVDVKCEVWTAMPLWLMAKKKIFK